VIVGVILAGGQSRRMGGGDKTLRMLGGRTMLAHVVERIAPQVDALAINANGEASRFAEFKLPVLPDPIGGFAGPLAGILAGLEWAATFDGCETLITVAADAPFLPRDLVVRLLGAARAADRPLACAGSDGRTHPVFGAWRVSLAIDLHLALFKEDIRKVDRWTARHGVAVADFPIAPHDPFLNVNSAEDLAAAEAILSSTHKSGE
jgi:molybdopterin-guanine dinucleotide biosynthesis protein A